MMEAYLEKPCGPQSFLFPQNTPWGLHVHDRVVGQGAYQEGPINNLKKVVYLHRDPASVIFSQLKYEGNAVVPKEHVEKLINEYATHLRRWRFENDDIENILDISYEEIKQDPAQAIAGVVRFIGHEVDDKKINSVCQHTDKSMTKRMTPHDPNALSDQSLLAPDEYARQRENFIDAFSDMISEKFEGLR